MDITINDLCAYVGLVAVGAVTINMLLGLLMAFRYSPVRYWPHHHINYFRLHNWSGYIALSFAILHPIILLFNNTVRFKVLEIVYPVHSPVQPLENTIGAIALYFTAFLVITSYFRVQLGRHLWKSFHFTVYVGAAAMFWHSLLTNPDLKKTPIDWLDGGKVFVEICAVIIVGISLLRWRYSVRKAHRLHPAGKTASAV
jgi:predicted ferric reductase